MGTLVQIRDVPERVHRRLKARAAIRGSSLSAYLRVELEHLAELPTSEELRERLDALEPVRLSESVVAARRAARREEGWE